MIWLGSSLVSGVRIAAGCSFSSPASLPEGFFVTYSYRSWNGDFNPSYTREFLFAFGSSTTCLLSIFNLVLYLATVYILMPLMCTHTHLRSLACYITQPSEMFMHTVWLYHNVYKIRVYCYWLHCLSVLIAGFGKVVVIISWLMNSDLLRGLCFGYVQHSVLKTVPQKLIHAEQFHFILRRQVNFHKIFLDK